MKLEVGEFYLTEDGRIIKVSEQKKDYFLDEDDYIYTESGINDDENTERNLIAHIPKELHYDIIKRIKTYHIHSGIRDAIDTNYKHIKD